MAGMLTGVLAALLLMSAPAFAQTKAEPTITVSAIGKATIAPDMAILNLAVVREAKTAREALDANSKATADVLKAMQDAGIEDRDLQTSNFNIQPRYVYPKRRKDGAQLPPTIVGYVVTNGLTVRVRKLAELGKILDQSVTLGVNSGGNVTFSNSNSDTVVEQARRNAMKSAVRKAKILTEEAGVALGRILNISEQNRGRPRPRALARAARSLQEDSVAVPVAAGENEYSVTVNVSWEIAQ